MLVSRSLDAIATFLEQHEDTLRIRKLLFCACEKRWENDTGVLRSLSLEHLVSKLHDRYTNRDQLSKALFSVVQQLNRQSQYTRLTQIVLEQMTNLYGDEASEAQTQFKPVDDRTEFKATPETEFRFSYDQIAKTLDRESSVIRIRKMLWFVCRQQWEKNSQLLLNVDLTELLQEIQFTCPTHSDLRQALKHIVNNVNRQAEYSAIARTILQHLEPLYRAAPQPDVPAAIATAPPQSEPTPVVENDAEMATHVSSAKAAMSEANTLIISSVATAELQTTVSSQPPQVPPTLDKTVATAEVKTTVSTRSPLTPPAENTAYNLNTATDFNPITATPAATPEETATHAPYDAFNVRLEVMKYANPLWAKILVFSVLHHTFETRGQDWSHLRTQPFDNLLRELHEAYETLEVMTQQLYQTAEQLESPDDSLQAAEAIAKAMRPYYAPTAA